MAQVQSSVINFVRYDALARELTVSLHTGGLYVYVDVPAERYEALLAAPSKGAFYNEHIRDCFAYKR